MSTAYASPNYYFAVVADPEIKKQFLNTLTMKNLYYKLHNHFSPFTQLRNKIHLEINCKFTLAEESSDLESKMNSINLANWRQRIQEVLWFIFYFHLRRLYLEST